ncbi:VapE domain-containing protein [Alteriqipengyuania sp. 357]
MADPHQTGGPSGPPFSNGSAIPAVKIKAESWPLPPSDGGKGIPPTLENFEHLLQCYGIELRFNAIKKRVDIDLPGFKVAGVARAAAMLTQIENPAIRHRMSPAKVRDYILALGSDQPYDPFADWIDSKPWDSKGRLAAIAETLVPEDDYPHAMRTALVIKWLRSIVAATYEGPGFRARGVLTLQGGQGIGKTAWFARLVGPSDLRDDVVKLGHSWDGGHKDARLTAIRHRIVELGEIEGSFRREIDALKAFLTDTTDKIRPPYGRVEEEYPRSTIFGASVNDPQFLLDNTGNSRFWTIAVKEIDYLHDIDMQQVFAELKATRDKDAIWHLTREEETTLDEINSRHSIVSAIEARITTALHLELKDRKSNPRLTANEVLHALGIKNPSNRQSKEANVALRKLLGDSKRIRGQNRWPIPWGQAPDPDARDYFEQEEVFT